MTSYDRAFTSGDYRRAARMAIANGQAAPTVEQQWQWADAAIAAAVAANVRMSAGQGRYPDWVAMLRAIR